MVALAGVNTQDHVIEHKLGRLILNPFMHRGVILTEGTPNLVTGLGAGTPTIASELEAGLEITGIPLDDADELYYLVDIPGELGFADLARDMWLELLFTSNKATAHAAIDFKAFLKGFALGVVFSDVLSTPDVSLAFAAQAVSATRKLCKAVMPLNAPGTFANDEMLGVVIELDDKGDGAANEAILIGARLVYTREICHATGVKKET